MNALIDSLERLIRQSTEALGPEAESTLKLQQQLAAVLAEQEKSRKVFWLQAAQSKPGPDETKG